MVMNQNQINPPPPPSTPARAPWADVQQLARLMTTLIEIYEARTLGASTQAIIQIQEEGGGVAAAPGATQVAISVDSQIRTPWANTEPFEILRASPRNTNPIKSIMYFWGGGKRLVIWVNSTLDQDVQLQVKGNIRNNSDVAAEIGPSLPCAAGGSTSIGLDWDDWHPYIGIEVTVPTAPTDGELTIEVVEQI